MVGVGGIDLARDAHRASRRILFGGFAMRDEAPAFIACVHA